MEQYADNQEEDIVEEQNLSDENEKPVKEEILVDEAESLADEAEKKRIEKIIEDMCNMKAEELRLMGIRATGKQVWLYVASTYKKGYPEFHQIVNDILSLKSTKFMNWLLIEAQKGTYTP